MSREGATRRVVTAWNSRERSARETRDEGRGSRSRRSEEPIAAKRSRAASDRREEGVMDTSPLVSSPSRARKLSSGLKSITILAVAVAAIVLISGYAYKSMSDDSEPSRQVLVVNTANFKKSGVTKDIPLPHRTDRGDEMASTGPSKSCLFFKSGDFVMWPLFILLLDFASPFDLPCVAVTSIASMRLSRRIILCNLEIECCPISSFVH